MTNKDISAAKRAFTPSELNLTNAAYSINDFARIVGIGRNKIYEAKSKGELVVTKLGKRSLITAPDGADFINRLRAASTGA